MSSLPFPRPDGRSFGKEGCPVDVAETHISWVFLVDDCAYKVKKPVDFGFVDFSTMDRRRYFCEREFSLNAVHNPALYLGVVPVSVANGRTRFDEGAGEIVDFAVKMRRFDAQDVLLTRARETGLGSETIDAVAGCAADLHRRAAAVDSKSPFGTLQQVRRWSDDNLEQIARLLRTGRSRDTFERIEPVIRGWPERVGQRLRDRRRKGHIRDCHGDLHLGNLLWVEGRVLPFDRIEFNDELRFIDTISDAAFTAMDLSLWCGEAACWRFVNGYLELSGDYSGAALFPFYIAYRALVRAKVALLSADPAGGPDRASLQGYLDLAARWAAPAAPRLWITLGLSGSGKTTRADSAARRHGAIVVHSDLERRRAPGCAGRRSTGSALGPGRYSAEATARVYAKLLEIAEDLLAAGLSVILDATFLDHRHRVLARRLAAGRGAGFGILHCDAPEEELRRRIRARPTGMSEATELVLEHQLRTGEPLREDEKRWLVAEEVDLAGNLDN